MKNKHKKTRRLTVESIKELSEIDRKQTKHAKEDPLETHIKNYMKTTLSGIRQDNAIKYLKSQGVNEEEATGFVRKRLAEYPVNKFQQAYP